MTNIIAFALQYKWKREKEADRAKNQRNESPMNVIFVRPSKNAKCKEGRLNATFFCCLFLLSIFYMATCRAYYIIVISMYLKHKNQPTMQKKLIILLSLFFNSWLLSMSRTFQSQIALNNNTKNGMCSTKICLVTIFIQFKIMTFYAYSIWKPTWWDYQYKCYPMIMAMARSFQIPYH